MKISVIIPVYNDEKNLLDCIKSLQNQSINEKFEIIVVEDGSKSNLKKELGKFSNVEYLWKDNGGPASARNLGIRKSQGKYIAFIDSDCIANRDWLESLFNKLKENPHLGGVGGRIVNYNLGCISNTLHLIEFGEFTQNTEKLVRTIPSCNSIYSKRTLLRINLFDEQLHYGEDVDLNWRIIKHKKKILYYPIAVVSHKTSNEIKKAKNRMFLMGQGVYNTRYKHKGLPNGEITNRWLICSIFPILPFISSLRKLNLFLDHHFIYNLFFSIRLYFYFWKGVIKK